MLHVSYYCPASISLIFKICPHKNLLKMGSLGVGFTVDRGVTSRVTISPGDEITFNNRKIRLPTVHSVKNYLTKEKIKVSLKSPLPLGCGFGLSAASSLATAFALNRLLALKKNDDELIRIAHLSEIENHTGLGSVGTESVGGFLWKKSPGLPVDAVSLPFLNKEIYVLIRGKIETSRILRSERLMQTINTAADTILLRLNNRKQISLSEILDLSYLFAKNAKLLSSSHLALQIEKLRSSHIHATMAMLGRVIVCDKDPKNVLRNYPIMKLNIVKSTVKQLDV